MGGNKPRRKLRYSDPAAVNTQRRVRWRLSIRYTRGGSLYMIDRHHPSEEKAIEIAKRKLCNDYVGFPNAIIYVAVRDSKTKLYHDRYLVERKQVASDQPAEAHVRKVVNK